MPVLILQLLSSFSPGAVLNVGFPYLPKVPLFPKDTNWQRHSVSATEQSCLQLASDFLAAPRLRAFREAEVLPAEVFHR